ncbi:MAG: ATP-dependent 6-phosphofructokinase [Candidatus Cloacimonetes bacterium]|nr:ATP-dependent 6-phosphofructokinase [Candidatus Cloacimonadota bacterium]
MRKKRVLVVTGGGDCPGLNAVIRGIVKRAHRERNWSVIGSIEAFDGVLREPMELVNLTLTRTAGIHVKGGTIIRTTNKGGPFKWPVKDKDGNWISVDRSDDLLMKLQYNNIDSVISIGGDGSQRISQQLFEKGCPIIGVPKTIDNDLMATDFTFGFLTAVDIASDAVDKLVSTAESHNRTMILEVMGRDAGWIAIYAAIAGGAEICLIPEIPYDIDILVETIRQRYQHGRTFCNIVIAEGATSTEGEQTYTESDEVGYENKKLGGAGMRLMEELKQHGLEVDMRVSILGHLQRGGTPCAFDRVLATQFGVKAFELVLEEKWGHMVAYRHPDIVAVQLQEAIEALNYVKPDSNIIATARGVGMCLGDKLITTY